MKMPLVLLLVSLALLFLGQAIPGWSDLAALAMPPVLASFLLLVVAVVRGRRPHQRPAKPRVATGFARGDRQRKVERRIVVDGSNVMHWKDGTAQIETLRQVVRHLEQQGYAVGVVFDANAGYKIADRYFHNAELSRLLGLPKSNVVVVAKGTLADPALLNAARSLEARVVSNDRFRDWEERHPEIRQPGYLIRGGFDGDRLWMNLD